MDWITLDSVIFAPVILYLENWINIEMERSREGAALPRCYQHQMEGLLLIMIRMILCGGRPRGSPLQHRLSSSKPR